MKKVLSVLAVSAFVLTASSVFAGGPGKMAAGCPDACQGQIDDLQSSQAQQNEQLGAHGTQLENHEGRIKTLETPPYDPWYARVGVRAAWIDASYEDEDYSSDVGFGGALAFGRQFGDFRAELELAHQKTDGDDFGYDYDIKVTTVMVNGYYELPVADAFSVYAMAGVGFANYKEEWDDGYDDDSNAFAYKAGLGVTYNFASNMAADLGYEYLGVADNDTTEEINGHNIVASFRYKF